MLFIIVINKVTYEISVVYNCHKQGHIRNKCCYNCHKQGHIRNKCCLRLS
ncbi:predicted protein [Nematostella vectensis]|uniref:CCHC-type domain-containing protein n=1 Tax=Nematostella vectensis TaxID=45351 RepID=A7SK83_NEMVE|nr:predicted protein [Nematostella vectensis]|eukprot:XP_001627960.1 predicted protein [Nematostella vectensis]